MAVFLHAYQAPFWAVWLAQVLFCYSVILIAMRLFGKLGVMVFMSIAVIAANIQVNRLALVPGFHFPVTLGTAIMASTYFASDLEFKSQVQFSSKLS